MNQKKSNAVFKHKIFCPEYQILQDWLYATGSLTEQLTQLGQGQFFVEPIKNYFKRPSRTDSLFLNVPHQHTAWFREVFLYGSEPIPWVKARSIFPVLSLQKKARIFKTLGRKPIGLYLFQRTTPLCERRVFFTKEGWTRQSRYTWHGCDFMVEEVFLPSFIAFLKKSTQVKSNEKSHNMD